MKQTRHRIPLFNPQAMSPEQERVYSEIVNGPRGRLVGPLRAILHHADLADRWQKLGEVLRYRTSLPKMLVELAILVTARRWTSQVEWFIHEREARAAGLAPSIITALQRGEVPVFDDAGQQDVYEFSRQLQTAGDVAEDVYQRIFSRWGTVGVVELSSVVGYYTMVSMTLNVHDIPLPDEADGPPLADIAAPGELVTLDAAEPLVEAAP